MYRYIICSFIIFITRNKRICVREGRRWLSLCTHELVVRIFCKQLPLRFQLSWVYYRANSRHQIISVSPGFSTFTIIVRNHLRASNHLSLSYIFVIFKHRRRFFTSQHWAVWRKNRSQNEVTSGCYLQPVLCLVSSCLLGIYILDAHTNSPGHTTSILFTLCTWTCSF